MSNDIYFGQPPKKDSSNSSGSYKSDSYVYKKNSYSEKIDPSQIKPSAPKNSGGKKAAPKKAKKKNHKVLKTVLAVILVLVLAVTGTAAVTVNFLFKDYEPLKLEDNAYISENELMSSPGVTNILLMGIDTMNTQDSSRSDSMILLSVDGVRHTLKLTSFMRDTYVEIPGHGSAKLNAACTYGGPQLVVDTIEYNFKIKIDAYAKIGYDIFEEIVNGVGGVTIPEIDETEAYAMGQEQVYLEPGTNIHLDGHQALIYCRIRKGQSDFYRTERQRETLTLLAKQALKCPLTTLIGLGRSFLEKSECSITKSQISSLALKAALCLAGDIEQGRVPADGTWDNGTRNGQSVLLVNYEKNTEYLKEFIYG